MTPTITAKDLGVALQDGVSKASIEITPEGKITCVLIGFWNGRNLAAAVKGLKRQYNVRKYELVKSQKKEASK